ncbi:hypothetical protein AYO22_10457 [Fonsecaea multimorphosa]|nr:hypothetical protein AYO22_10457 [Fonsecaea multimorphosa]
MKEQNEGKNELNDAQLAYVAGIFIEAGSDTTASSLLSFCLAMVTHSHVLKKCQEEVDACCPEHSPTADEARNLPYLKACLTETLRWRPVAPGGIPHALTEDNVYGEYVLPKGTMLLANTWGIHHDESEYVNPAEFIPERFLDNKFGTIKKEKDGENDRRRTTYAFGAGRRRCMELEGNAYTFANMMQAIIAAKIVWAFDISPTSQIDSSIETGYTDGFVLAPKPYAAKFVPRTQERVSIIAKEAEEAEKFLSRFN